VPPVSLESAAFGDAVHTWPLPSAMSPSELWWRAVAEGGQGRYASAHADLARLRRTGQLASLAHSTTGSLVRQLGRHAAARHWDGLALRLAGGDVEARSDALVGLAADALGLGRFGASSVLLDSARRLDGGPGRLAVRLRWVSAELAMARGDGAQAVRWAREGIERCVGVSPRHRIKSDIVLAAALCTAGQLDEARAVADPALTATGDWGLIPLRWAVAGLLVGIGSDARAPAEVSGIRDSAAALIERRGGRFAAG